EHARHWQGSPPRPAQPSLDHQHDPRSKTVGAPHRHVPPQKTSQTTRQPKPIDTDSWNRSFVNGGPAPPPSKQTPFSWIQTQIMEHARLRFVAKLGRCSMVVLCRKSWSISTIVKQPVAYPPVTWLGKRVCAT